MWQQGAGGHASYLGILLRARGDSSGLGRIGRPPRSADGPCHGHTHCTASNCPRSVLNGTHQLTSAQQLVGAPRMPTCATPQACPHPHNRRSQSVLRSQSAWPDTLSRDAMSHLVQGLVGAQPSVGLWVFVVRVHPVPGLGQRYRERPDPGEHVT